MLSMLTYDFLGRIKDRVHGLCNLTKKNKIQIIECNKKNCTCDKLKVGEAAGTKGKAKFTDP